MQKIRLALAGTVTAVWTVGYGLSYVKGAQAPQELTALMALILGWAFAGQVRDKLKGKEEEED